MKRSIIVCCLFLLSLPVSAQYYPPGTWWYDDTEEEAEIIHPPPHYATEETIAVVMFPRVNLRNNPDTITGTVVDIALAGERFPIVKVSNDERWYLVESGGGQAWIHRDTVIATNPDAIPEGDQPSAAFIASVNQQVELFANTMGVESALRIRSGPGTSYEMVGIIPANGRASVIGRNYYGTWFLIEYGSITGWVSSFYAILPPSLAYNSIPIVR